MKCYVLLVNRTKAIYYKNAEYNANAGIIRKGLGKGTEGFFIPDSALTFDLQKGRGGAIPLWIVNERTGTALSLFEGDLKQTILESEKVNEEEKPEEPQKNPSVSTRPKLSLLSESGYQKRQNEKEKGASDPKEHGVGGLISFVEKSDPATKLKLNVLTKQAFWEMLAKQLRMGVLKTIIYLCAGGGIFLIALYVIKVIFLKESSI